MSTSDAPDAHRRAVREQVDERMTVAAIPADLAVQFTRPALRWLNEDLVLDWYYRNDATDVGRPGSNGPTHPPGDAGSGQPPQWLRDSLWNQAVATSHEVDPAGDAYAQRATAAAREPEPAMDDVTATIEGRCACPCRRSIGPDSPSAWFATHACQRNWHGARCADPQDVYRRPDAAPYPRWDQQRTQLNEADHPDPARRPAPDGLPWWRTLDGITAVLAYRRRCPGCGALNVSASGADLGGLVPYREGDVVVLITNRMAPCGRCGGRWPDPQPTARAEVSIPPHRIRLALLDDDWRVGTVLNPILTDEGLDPDALYRQATRSWLRMAAILTERRRLG